MMGWRAQVDEALEGRNNRNSSNTSSEIGPSDPSVPSVPAPISLLREWGEAVGGLDARSPRAGFSLNRWANLVEGSYWLMEHYGRQLAREGWSTGDVFGVHVQPGFEGHGGLVDHLGNHRALVLADGEARWRYLGTLPQTYKRGWFPHLAPFWSVEL